MEIFPAGSAPQWKHPKGCAFDRRLINRYSYEVGTPDVPIVLLARDPSYKTALQFVFLRFFPALY
jgi:hypothetical protein